MRATLVLVLMLTATLAAPALVVAPGTPGFTPVTAALVSNIAEPSIAIDRTVIPNVMYASGPAGPSPLYRSMDGGLTWTKPIEGAGCGGDTDIAIDAVGRVYFSEMIGAACGLSVTLPVMVSEDRANTWTRVIELDPTTTEAIGHDRQWLDARGNGQSILIARNGGVVDVWTTTNAWATHLGPMVAVTTADITGPVVYAPDGTVYFPFYDAGKVMLAKSTNGGTTWTTKNVGFVAGSTLGFPALDVDAAGKVYVAWEDASGGVDLGIVTAVFTSRIYYAASSDGGNTWTAPKLLSETPSQPSIFPWIAAGAAGKIDVAWYVEVTSPGFNLGPSLGSANTRWDVQMAQVTAADTAAPSVVRTTAYRGFHTGSICTNGLACLNPAQFVGGPNAPLPFDRRVLDFFELDVDSAGNAFIAFPKSRAPTGNGDCAGGPPVLCDDDRLGDPILQFSDLTLAVQTSGPTIN